MSKTKIPLSKGKEKNIAAKQDKNGLDFFDTNKPAVIYSFIGVIILAILLFFSKGVFEGKVFASADNLSPMSFKTFLDDAKAQGIFPLWIPYIFMGMPSLASMTAAVPAMHNIYSFIWDSAFEMFSGGNLFALTLPYYFIFAITLFFYAKYKFNNNLVALFSSLLGVFATGIIQLIIVGHHTKMMTFAFFPLILLIVEKIADDKEKGLWKMFLYFGLLSIILYIQLHFHHIQMLYYSFMMMGFYLAYLLVYAFVKKLKKANIVKAMVIFIAGLFVAVAMDANIIMSIKEYNKYSMRGESSITTKAENKDTDKPLTYDYATNWSFSPGEVLTFVLPYYYGFGSVEIKDPKSGQMQRANLYWGQMPFTDSPVYFGVIVLLLAVIGVSLNFKKNPFVQATTFVIIFFLFLSFGRTLPILYDLFYNYMPYFSSFRAPVMIHYYMDFAFVVLAGYGLMSIINLLKEPSEEKKLLKTSYIVAGVGFLFLLLSVFGFENSYTDSVLSGPLVQKYQAQGYNAQQVTQYVKQQLAPIAYENIISDLRLHGFLILLIGGLILVYAQRKVAKNIMLLGIILIGLFDLLSVSSKTVHWDDKKQRDDFVTESDFTKWILAKEPDTYNYRVAQFNKGNLITTNDLAYFRLHQFNGYQGAKLRIYQDAVDIAGGENPFLLGLANVKYIISDTPLKDTVSFVEAYKGSNIVYVNKYAMPRSFFVNETKVETGLNILNNIKTGTFDPRNTAFVEKNVGIQIDKPDSTVSSKIANFGIHEINYDVNASGNNLLVLDEMYYPAGWKAYIDGNETEIFKTDYFLRSVIVPKGKHKVDLRFYPETYFTGKKISIAANILVTLILAGGIAGIFISRKKAADKTPNSEQQT
ncbi:MAG: YfhO family protein [Ignavibacteria bacterium]|nr:YfhO family protein [Ignavibacteria bacterium]